MKAQLFLVVEPPEDAGGWAAAVPIGDAGLVLGRGPDCHLLLADPHVSRRAVELRPVEGRVSLRAASEAGFVVDGARRQEALLGPGDAFVVGRSTLRIVDAPPRREDGRRGASPSLVIGRDFRRFLETVGGASEADELLERLLLGAVEICGAERGFVLLRREGEARLVPVASHGVKDLDGLMAVSSTVARSAMTEGRLVYVENSEADEWTRVATSLHEGPRTIMAAPLAHGDEVFGAVYLDRPWTSRGARSFDGGVLACVAAIAAGVLAAGATRSRLLQARERLGALASTLAGHEELVLGPAAASAELRRLVARAAAQDVTVLLTGETGTGKELVARAIHRASSRREGPFIPVHCAALPAELIEAELFGVEKGAYTGAASTRPGRFELASGGTVFLDEIGDMPPALQVKILRVLQERTVTRLGATTHQDLDLRVICATNVDLERAVREGRFREDLFYRINVLRMTVPALRHRKEDVLLLARHFLAAIGRKLRKPVQDFDGEAVASLEAYRWPGNVRELRNAIERAVVVEEGERIAAASLGLGGAVPRGREDDETLGYDEAKTAFERHYFGTRLARHQGNMDELARATGISRSTLYRRLQGLGLLESK